MFVDLIKNHKYKEQAAVILHKAFANRNIQTWKTIEQAQREVELCTNQDYFCVGLIENDVLIGWAGLRPFYEKTWELHPLCIDPDFQNTGYGRKLLFEIENKARQKGIIGIALGSDDENKATSISRVNLTGENIYKEMQQIKNYKNHPYEFYLKCGYIIVGVIPDANGKGKPDILMWKKIS